MTSPAFTGIAFNESSTAQYVLAQRREQRLRPRSNRRRRPAAAAARSRAPPASHRGARAKASARPAASIRRIRAEQLEQALLIAAARRRASRPSGRHRRRRRNPTESSHRDRRRRSRRPRCCRADALAPTAARRRRAASAAAESAGRSAARTLRRATSRHARRAAPASVIVEPSASVSTLGCRRASSSPSSAEISNDSPNGRPRAARRGRQALELAQPCAAPRPLDEIVALRFQQPAGERRGDGCGRPRANGRRRCCRTAKTEALREDAQYATAVYVKT